MKINEIIDEAPNSRLKNVARGMGARILNKVGAKSAASNLAGKHDSIATANNLYDKFEKFLGTQQKKAKEAQGADVKAFFAKIGYQTNIPVPKGPLDKTALRKIFNAAGAERTAGPKASASYAKEPAEPKVAPQVKFAPKQPVQFKSKAGKLINATVVGKSKDGDDSVVVINSGKQNFIIKRAKLLDPKTGKPF